jgi:hypothetical protein
MFMNICTRSDIDRAAEVQLLVPPTVSEKNLVASDAICCIVEHAEMCGVSLPQLEVDDDDAP